MVLVTKLLLVGSTFVPAHPMAPAWRAELAILHPIPVMLPSTTDRPSSYILVERDWPIWQCIRYRENTNSYAWGGSSGDGGGAYQFEPPTWNYAVTLSGSLGGAWGSATPIQQDAAAQALARVQGYGAWRDDGCAG